MKKIQLNRLAKVKEWNEKSIKNEFERKKILD